MGENKQASVSKHWPVVLLALLVVAIFITVMVTFQVSEMEWALLKTYDGQLLVQKPGLHFRWPFINSVWRHDKRVQCYEMIRGHNEQYTTKDNQQIVVSTYVFWRISDPVLFMRSLDSTIAAEEKLDSEVRGARSAIIPRFEFGQLINPNAGHTELTTIEDQILAQIKKPVEEKYGIEIMRVGFRQLGFPSAVTQNVYQAMISERMSKAKSFEDEGKAEADRIRSEAETKASKIVAEAQAEATKIRGQGDAAAAATYKVFASNPKLAAFLRSLEALKVSLGENDTLILDTKTAPWTLLAPGALDEILNQESAK